MFINLHVSFKIFFEGVYNNKGSPRTTTPWCSPLPTSWRSSISALGLSSQNSEFDFFKRNGLAVMFLIISTKNQLLRLGKKSDILHNTDTGFFSCGHESYLLFRLMGRWWGSCQEWICRFPMRQSFCARSPQLPGFVVVIWWVPCFSSHVKCLNIFFAQDFFVWESASKQEFDSWPFIQLKDWDRLGHYPFLSGEIYTIFVVRKSWFQEAECNSTMRGLAGKEHVIHWDGDDHPSLKKVWYPETVGALNFDLYFKTSRVSPIVLMDPLF